jgi:hypothetical protein
MRMSLGTPAPRSRVLIAHAGKLELIHDLNSKRVARVNDHVGLSVPFSSHHAIAAEELCASCSLMRVVLPVFLS